MRPAESDLMQAFRFHVIAANENDEDPLAFTTAEGFEGGGQAGFQSVTLPEVSVEAIEYREGTFKDTQKYPGVQTVTDCTLMRGIAKTDTTFHDWVMNSINGEAYRATVTIYHFQRTQMGSTPSDLGQDFRRIICHECIPIRAKPGGDLDATSGEVSMAEIDFAMEKFELDKGE